MERFSCKIEIINHFDDLINNVDIDIEHSLQKYNENDQQLLSDLLRSSENLRKEFSSNFYKFKLNFFDDTFDSSKEKPLEQLDSWPPESTKVLDYLKQVRIKTIEELRKAQEDTLEYYKLNSARFKTSELTIDQLISELFADKHYFQIGFNESKKGIWPFTNFIFATDFYLHPCYIDSLEKLINDEKDPFGQDAVFDDNIVLTGLLYKMFSTNLDNAPKRVIHVSKQDILNIKSIDFIHIGHGVNITSSATFDLSKLVELSINLTARNSSESVIFNIEGLVSLEKFHLRTTTAAEVEFSIKNVPSLRNLHLSISGTIDESIVTRLFEQVPHIEELRIDGNFSSFKLDDLVYLRKLALIGTLNENFNCELFKNLCNQLEDINIDLSNIDWKTFVKLFESYQFPYLVKFTLRLFYIRRLNTKFFNRFRSLRHLNLSACNIEVIEHNSFSSLANLELLYLIRCQIRKIEKNAFSKLKNLKKVDLSFNDLKNVDRKFIGLGESAEYFI